MFKLSRNYVKIRYLKPQIGQIGHNLEHFRPNPVNFGNILDKIKGKAPGPKYGEAPKYAQSSL